MAVIDVNSQVGRSLLHLLDDADEEHRDKYLKQRVNLHKAALKGDWKEAKLTLEEDWTLVRAAITKGEATTLHVAAAGANHDHFVEELMKVMKPEDFTLQDKEGKTAFCYATLAGNMRIVEIMLKESEILPTIRDGERTTPLHMAALQGRSEMAMYLYPKTVHVLDHTDKITLFFYCVSTEIYDLALTLLELKGDLAFEKDQRNNETALHILARRRITKSSLKKTQQLQLVSCLWNKFLSRGNTEIMSYIREPSHAIFDAVEVGNFEFLAELISAYPDLICEVDGINRSIIHIAVLHRRADIFNLIHDIGPIKYIILRFLDTKDKSNLLHMAAKLAPLEQLNLVSGAAFQMTLELVWFEEVKKIMPPTFIEMKNGQGLTPRQLFTQDHKELLRKAESWMKKTSNSCMVVSSLIATGVFSAAFSAPGGDENDYLRRYFKARMLIFVISDAIALISSSASLFIFLSIVISRYTEDDFHKSLPFKLISGLVTLFIAIISMMIAFSIVFFFTGVYDYKSWWVPYGILLLSILPVALFVVLLSPIWSDIVYLTRSYWNLFKRSHHKLYSNSIQLSF